MLKRSKKWYFKRVRLITKKRGRPKKTNRTKIWAILIAFILFIPLIIWSAWFYKNIWEPLPDLSQIEDIAFSQTSKITDRNWVVLYEIFEENRKYVEFSQISEDMINAIVAVEDKNFWTNPWIDITGIMRALINDVIKMDKAQWWSTLTQQLIKNVLLTPEKTITRKAQEIVLSVQLNWYIKEWLRNSYWSLDENLLDRKVKEKILELYLNYIFLWNNAYWIEAASQTYFWIPASELNILQSSIIASLPRSPGVINPYNNSHLLMWYITANNQNDEQIQINETITQLAKEKIEEKLKESTISFQQDTNRLISFLRWLLDFNINYEWETINIKYLPWRKDIALARMYEDNHITQQEFKDAFIEWIWYEFQIKRTDIRAPHFVFEIIRQLEENYSSDIIRKWWLTIKTSLDYELQKIAEESITNNMEYVRSRNWNNSAMIYIDTKEWDILAYVWSQNYFDTDIDWNVDMIQSNRQPWSALKPLVYAKAFLDLRLTPDSPIYDIPFKIWNDEPVNSDWNFLGLMSIKTSLAYSRNIPSIKLYFAVWQERWLKSFFKELWFTTFRDDIDYWYPIVLWAWEVKMMELAKAYSHLTAQWRPAKINPILEIKWSDWSIIYKRNVELEKQVIPAWIAYIMREILSDPNNMPPTWRNNFTINWLKFGIKSWTSNLRTRDWRILPRDWLLVTYTPSKVAIFWAWNTRWEAMNAWSFWWRLTSWIWKWFFNTLREQWKITNEDYQAAEYRNVSISEISWDLASSTTPLRLIRNSVWYIHNMPINNDDSIITIKVDWMCNWKISNLTPSSSIINWYVINPQTMLPWNRDLEDIYKWWNDRWIWIYKEKLWWPVFLLEEPTEICTERQIFQEQWWINIVINNPSNWQKISRNPSIRYNISWPFQIDRVTLSIWQVELLSERYNRTNVTDIKNVTIPSVIWYWEHTMTLSVVDNKWYSSEQNVRIEVIDSSNSIPYILNNRTNREQNDDWTYTLTVMFWDDLSWVVWWQIYQNSELIREFTWNITNFNVPNLDNITYIIRNWDWNIWEWNIR